VPPLHPAQFEVPEEGPEHPPPPEPEAAAVKLIVAFWDPTAAPDLSLNTNPQDL
jgi:hypothetical protein